MELQTTVEQEITELHNDIAGHLQQSLDKAIRIGELLAEQKRNLKHGDFTAWMINHLPFTDRTARNYMRLYENREKLKTETVSDLTSAYKLLAAPQAPEQHSHSQEAQANIQALKDKYGIDKILADFAATDYGLLVSQSTSPQELLTLIDKMQSYTFNLAAFRLEIERHIGMLLKEIDQCDEILQIKKRR